MPEFTPQELADWSGGTWTHLPESPIRQVVHDTRDLPEEGGLYIALPGARVDGHDFLAKLADLGAAGAVCKRGRAHDGIACLEVDDPARALCDFARRYRATWAGTVVGITGSAGKTTVKDLLACMLTARGPTTRTKGNWNNDIGLPLSMLRMDRDDAYGVFEVAMNAPGEIAALAEILRPSIGVVTSIGEAHLERLGSVGAIAEEKCSLYSALPAEGLAVVDQDSEWTEFMMRRCGATRRVGCSLKGPAEITGSIQSDGGLRVVDTLRGEEATIYPPGPGEHMMKNMLLAITVARELDLSFAEILKGLKTYRAAPMRWENVQVGGRHIVNDAYNANPLSMRSAIRTFASTAEVTKAWLVVGGMHELGEAEKTLHRTVGEYIDEFPFRGVIGIGERGRWILEGIRSVESHPADSVEDAADLVMAHTAADAELLLKASRAEALETLVPLLEKKTQGEPAR